MSCPRSRQSWVPLGARPGGSGRGPRAAARIGNADPFTRLPSPTRGQAPPRAAAAPLPASPGAGCRCLARWPCWPVSWRFAVASPRRPRPQRPWRRAGEASAAGAGRTPPIRNAECAAEGAAEAAHHRKGPRDTSSGPAPPRRPGLVYGVEGVRWVLSALLADLLCVWARRRCRLEVFCEVQSVRGSFPSRLPLLYGPVASSQRP